MDGWKYHHITGRYLDMLNPCDPAKLERLYDLMDLGQGIRVLDMGSGKGEALVRLARRHRICGVGIDISPQFTSDATARAKVLGEAGKDLRFIAMDGRTYEATADFDIALCLGASWIFGGMRTTAQSMSALVRSGGLVVIGEPHLVRPPSLQYLQALDDVDAEPEAELTLAENIAAVESSGLVTLFNLVSSVEEYDTYEWQRMRAAELYALEHPGDPDVPELLRRARTHRDLYLRYAREMVGWSLYLFKKSPAVSH